MNATNQPAASNPRLTNILALAAHDPGNMLLVYAAVDLCIEENQIDQAEQLLNGATAEWANHPGVFNRRAILALRRNDTASAITYLEKIVAAGQADGPVRYNLGYASYLAGDFAKARKALEPALDQADNIPALASLYATTLQQLGENDAAIAYAESRLRAKPDDAELQGVLALLYFDGEKDIDACRRYTASALRAMPHHAMALVIASSLALMDEQPQAALELGIKVVERNPADGRAWSSIGLAQMNLRNLPAAQQALKNAVRYMPGHIGTWHVLAWSQLLQNDIDGAEVSFQKAAEIDRSFGETQGGLAIIAQMRGDTAAAKSLMEKARRLNPEGMNVQYVKLLQLQETEGKDAVKAFLEDVLSKRASFRGDSVLDMVRRMGRAGK